MTHAPAPRLQVVDSEQPSRVNTSIPESHFISALLSLGTYTPEAYGIGDQQFVAHRQVHEFCRRYQAQAKEAPPVHLVKEKFPSYTFTPQVSPTWAAQELYDLWKVRCLHKSLAQAASALQDDNADEALTRLRDAVTSLKPLASHGTDVTDLSYLAETAAAPRCPVSFAHAGISGSEGMLQQVTHGIGPGDLWYVAARMGVGKSWRLLEIAVAAAEAGWPVRFYSLEMPARVVKDRLHRIALRDSYRGHWDDITLTQRRDLVSEWADTAATITIHDPSSGSCTPDVVATAGDDQALVIIDYVGLMHTTSGQRSMEDWRAAAIISNELKGYALEHNVPVISAAQVNRSGDSAAEPSTAHLAQSDALGQDADMVLTLRTYSRRVLLNYVAKNRHGEQGAKWFTRFEPGAGRFTDITPDTARDLKSEDDERSAASIE